MNATIDQETICNAISIEWTVAHQSPTRKDWNYRWNDLYRMLLGMRYLANCAVDWDSRDIFQDINLLMNICHSRNTLFEENQYTGNDALEPLPAFLRRQAD